MDAAVMSFDGKAVDSVRLPDHIFGLEPRADILHRVVRWQLARRRAGTSKVKTRSEISATGKKMYRQKGTGRARHSDRKATQFRGGMKPHGPEMRSHAHDLPKKVRALGLMHALSAKRNDGDLVIVDAARVESQRTKDLKAQLEGLGVMDVLVIDHDLDPGLDKAARNLPRVDILSVAGINVYDLLRRQTLVLTTSALAQLVTRFEDFAASEGSLAPGTAEVA